MLEKFQILIIVLLLSIVRIVGLMVLIHAMLRQSIMKWHCKVRDSIFTQFFEVGSAVKTILNAEV